MRPQLQCPNCNQFELGFSTFKRTGNFDHQFQQKNNIKPVPPEEIVRCGAFDCGYTDLPDKFIVQREELP